MTSLANGSQEILNPEIEKKQNNSVQAVIFSLLERLFLRVFKGRVDIEPTRYENDKISIVGSYTLSVITVILYCSI